MPKVRVGQKVRMGTPVKPQKRPSEGLTSIHRRIHCTATPDTGDLEGHEELDHIDIDNLINTLAEVAISVARREQQSGGHESGSLHQGQ